jgi:hypothetical protein
MKNLLALLVMATLLVFSLQAQADAQDLVQAEGVATIHRDLVDIARDKAIDNALRGAVEKVAGVLITSTSEVEDFQLKMDRILSESSGFVNSYKIISESRQGDTYTVLVEADVVTGKLKDRMSAINMIISRKAKPRLLIVFSEQAQKDAVAESAMAKFFLSKSFKLIDKGVLASGGGLPRLKDSGDNMALAEVAHRNGAEIVIIGGVEAAASNSFNIGGIEMFTNKVIVSGKVINGDTGEVIATESESKSAPGMKGDYKAIAEDATVKISRKLMDSVLERWSADLVNTTTVKLVISGVDDYADLGRLKELFALEIKGFKEALQRSYNQDRVEFDVETRGNTQGVADDLAAMTMNKRKFKIQGISQNTIEAKFLPIK